MAELFNVVPWFNNVEWLEVYNNIYVKSDKKAALNLLLIWKARCPSLPSGIESTLTLLEVHVQDQNSSDTFENDHLLRLAYCSAIMRFVNHMLDTETAKGSSLYKAAKNLGVPDWIVELRHDTAHSNKLPSLELLREATLISIEWLEKNYWCKYKECITDYVTGNKDVDVSENNKVAALMHFCISLSFCAHSRCKITNLSEIPNSSMKESIVNDARDLFGDQYDFSNLQTVSVSSLINILNSHSRKILNNENAVMLANKELLGDDSLFLSMEVLNYMGGDEFKINKRLSASYVQCYEVLLTFLHTNELLMDFILKLIEITTNTEVDSTKCLLAALWVSEILKALLKSKYFTDRIKRTTHANVASKKKQELRALYYHWFPNEKVKGLLLDIRKSVPEQLTKINFVEPIISTYNIYLKYFIKDLLILVEPHLPRRATDHLCKLAELIASKGNGLVQSTRIYTVDDLKLEIERRNEAVSEKENRSNAGSSNATSSVTPMEIEAASAQQNQNSYGIWKVCTTYYNWSSCPIGLLPWQCK